MTYWYYITVDDMFNVLCKAAMNVVPSFIPVNPCACICDALPQTISAFSLNKPVLSANPRRGQLEGSEIWKTKFSNVTAYMFLDFIATVCYYFHFKKRQQRLREVSDLLKAIELGVMERWHIPWPYNSRIHILVGATNK